MEVARFDVIVSDMKMPGINGVELLSRVKENYPDSIRIALSGHAEMEMLLESVQVTHQFLAKPSDAEHIRNVITQALALRQMLQDENLRACISKIDSLPTLPMLYSRVTSVAASPDGTLVEIGRIVGEDISMTAEILQIVNSAYFGLAREVSTAQEATTLLGLDVVRSLILSVKIFSCFKEAGAALNLENLNQHCHRTGILAGTIAKHEKMPKRVCDSSLMAGMLHDIGKLILATAYPDQYAQAHKIDEGSPEGWIAEQQMFGISHAEIGAYLLGVWNLPNPVVEAVAYHHIPEKAVQQPFSPLTATHIADALIHDYQTKPSKEFLSWGNMDYISRFAGPEKLESWRTLTDEVLGDTVN